MLLLGLKNNTTQSVLSSGVVSLGNVYRKYCKKINGITTFSQNGTSVTLQQSGIYHITATLVGNGSVVGDVVVSLLENNDEVTFSTQTMATATTSVKTFVLDYYAIVDTSCVLGQTSTNAKTISLLNSGIGASFTNVVFNVEKVV